MKRNLQDFLAAIPIWRRLKIKEVLTSKDEVEFKRKLQELKETKLCTNCGKQPAKNQIFGNHGLPVEGEIYCDSCAMTLF